MRQLLPVSHHHHYVTCLFPNCLLINSRYLSSRNVFEEERGHKSWPVTIAFKCHWHNNNDFYLHAPPYRKIVCPDRVWEDQFPCATTAVLWLWQRGSLLCSVIVTTAPHLSTAWHDNNILFTKPHYFVVADESLAIEMRSNILRKKLIIFARSRFKRILALYFCTRLKLNDDYRSCLRLGIDGSRRLEIEWVG